MGKNSLVKSTSKKAKEDAEATKMETSKKEKVVATPPPQSTPSSAQPAVNEQPEKEMPPPPTKEAKPKPQAVADPKPVPAEKAPPSAAPAPEPPEPPVTVTYDSPSGPSGGDPMDKTLLILAGCVLFLLILVIGASSANSSKYYIKKLPMGIEIQEGCFAPLGVQKVKILRDVQAPEEEKDVYKRNEVYPLIFKHFLQKADALLAETGMPDYDTIRGYLVKAQNYAVSKELARAVSKRLTAIDLNNWLYRANVAREQDTAEGMTQALDYLTQAGRLDIDADQKERIALQMDSVRERLRELEEIEAALEAMPQEPPAPLHK